MLGSARHQWEDGSRRLESEAGDSIRYAELCALVEAVVGELRQRIGRRFTLEELALAHGGAEDWVRETVREAAPPKGRAGIRDVALVQDAAFHVYARGAVDYVP